MVRKDLQTNPRLFRDADNLLSDMRFPQSQVYISPFITIGSGLTLLNHHNPTNQPLGYHGNLRVHGCFHKPLVIVFLGGYCSMR